MCTAANDFELLSGCIWIRYNTCTCINEASLDWAIGSMIGHKTKSKGISASKFILRNRSLAIDCDVILPTCMLKL